MWGITEDIINPHGLNPQCWFNVGPLFTPLPQHVLCYNHWQCWLWVVLALHTVGQHWADIGSVYLCRPTRHIVVTCPASKTYCPVLNVCRPAPATLAQHLTDVGLVLACALLRHWHQHKTLFSVEQLLAGAGDSGPALIRHWVSVVQTCSGHRYQPEIVMNIE